MNRLAASLAIACGAALFATTANAETVDELKRELAAKKAYIAKLERRLRDLEQRSPAPKPTLVTAPVAPPPPRVAVAPAPPPSPEDEEMERALERTLVREGALVLPPWTFELTPQFSYGALGLGSGSIYPQFLQRRALVPHGSALDVAGHRLIALCMERGKGPISVFLWP